MFSLFRGFAWRWFMKARFLALLSAAVLFGLAAVPAHASQGEYLALGDSVAFGFNPLLVDAGLAGNPNVFVGYPDIVAQRLGLSLTNASCPGETTGGFISTTNGADFRCLGYRFRLGFPLHVNYPGAQLAFALSFLATHPNTQLVTMDIGANDVFKLQTDTCGGDPACINAGIVAVLTNIDINLRIIFGEIRTVAHYQGMIVTLSYYGLTYDKAGQDMTNALNAPIIDATTANGGLVASGFDAFEARALAHDGSSCEAGLLIVKTPDNCDVHPSPQGRNALAGAIVQTIEKANGAF
jgi:lysophospholipase L1-like esterase